MLTTHRAKRRGASLASALIAVVIICGVMAVVLQCYLAGARGIRVTDERNAVTAALAAQLETLRATGFARLPAIGRHAIPLTALPKVQGISGRIVVEPGQMDGTRRVTALANWGQDPAHEEKLTMVIAKQGMDP